MSNWNNVVSPERNEIVFEGRNKEYGAYQIRKNYNRTVTITVGAVSLFCGLLFAAKLLFDMKVASDANKEAVLENVQIDLTPPPVDEKEPPPPPPPPPPPVVETVKFVPPVIKEDAREDEPPPPQEKLAETQVSTVTQEGNGDDAVVVPTEVNNGPVEEKAPEIFTIVEQMPEPPGGIKGFYEYVAGNIVYPSMAREAQISGKCHLKFVVEIDGSISNVEVLKGVNGCADCDKEAVRVLKSYPKKWTPGKQNGKSVRVYYNMPIRFEMK
ncbi:MAG: energy transducer TonB [Bacteroidia bacterium]